MNVTAIREVLAARDALQRRSAHKRYRRSRIAANMLLLTALLCTFYVAVALYLAH